VRGTAPGGPHPPPAYRPPPRPWHAHPAMVTIAVVAAVVMFGLLALAARVR
jgi:hypothetical protein